VSRRSLLITALCVAVLLPSAAAAQNPSPEAAVEPVLEPSPAPEAALTGELALADEPIEDPTAVLKPTAERRPKVDFKVGKWELQKLKWKDLRFNGGSPLPIETEGPQDAKGVPMRPLGPGGRLVYNPTVLAQQGMKRLASYLQTGKKHHLRQARKYADKLRVLSDGGNKRRWQPHWYDLGVHERGWVNSNSHGLTLAFISRFHEITGAEKRLKEARRLMAAFEQRPGNERWFSDITAKGYTWFEHWPDGRHDRTLNAHINAMFGIYDYWRVTGDPLAEVYFLGGAKTVRDKLYRFRRKGELSRYSLGGNTGTLHYHETHIDQLRTLSKMLGDPWFAKQADLFERDELQWKIKYRGARR
jgi:hypothetical protein